MPPLREGAARALPRLVRAAGAALAAALVAAPTAAPLAAQTRPAAAAAAPTPAAASRAPAAPNIAYTRFVLSNGLTLLVHEDHKAPIVAVNVWYHVGSKNEKPGRTGFAHLFEHLMFNGSEHFDDDYFKAVEPVGATDLNGTTNEDRTNYFQNVPSSALDRILWLESDRMGHLLGAVTQAKLDEQRGVVQNEKRQGENQPYGKAWITIAENTYPKGHPYSWSVIGSMEDLDAAKLDDVKDWFRTHYGPSNATIVLAGDITPDEARRKVERYFGDIPGGPPTVKYQTWVAPMQGVRRQVMQDRVPQARVHKVWNVPPAGDPDQVRVQLVGDLLGDGRSSRLYKRLVYADRSASDVFAYMDDREIGSQLLIAATAKPGGDLAAVERAMDDEIARLLRDGPTAEELARVKTQYRARLVRGTERIGGFGGKSDVLARGQVLRGDPEAYKKDLALVEAATAGELRDAARRWLAPGSYVLEVRPFPQLAVVPSDVDRKAMPAAAAPAEVRFPTPERATLASGLKVVLVRRDAVPVVRMRLLVDGGFAADRASAPGVASMTMRMLEEGTATRSALRIGDELASLGAELATGSELDASYVQLSVLRDKIDPALALYADVIRNPAFPAADLERNRQNTLARIQQEKVQPFGLALRVLPALLYGAGHAYGTPLTGSGTEASVRAMTRDQLVAHHRAWFKPNHATLVVVGDVTLAELRPKLERAFAGWAPGDVPAKAVAPVAARDRPAVYLLDRPGAEQSIVMAGQVVAPKANPDEFAIMAFNEAFGGAFTSRINLNLREDKHWSYGAGSFALDARGQRPWIVYAPVQTDKTRESLAEMAKELRAVAAERPVAGAELARVQDQQTRTLAGRWETGNAVLGSIAEQEVFGLPADWWSTYARRVRAVTPAAVSGAVGRMLQPGRLVWVVVGDRAKVEAGVRALGLGDVRLLDADGRPVGEATTSSR
jgi:zinc protease